MPFTNTPPPKAYDTHEYPRRDPHFQQMVDSFLTTGVVHNVCGSDGCHGKPVTAQVGQRQAAMQ